MEDHLQDGYELCDDCGGDDHVVDYREDQRICRDCGLTSSSMYEIYHYPRIPDYKRSTHMNKKLDKLMEKGGHIGGLTRNIIAMRFNMYEKAFNMCKRLKLLTRKNMLNYDFMIMKIINEMELQCDVTTFVKIPKLKKTLVDLEIDFIIINNKMKELL
jgi:hypothetical protein